MSARANEIISDLEEHIGLLKRDLDRTRWDLDVARTQNRALRDLLDRVHEMTHFLKIY